MSLFFEMVCEAFSFVPLRGTVFFAPFGQRGARLSPSLGILGLPFLFLFVIHASTDISPFFPSLSEGLAFILFLKVFATHVVDGDEGPFS